MKRIVMTIVLIITAIPAVLGSSCKGGYSGTTETATIGARPSEVVALIHVAESQQYFSTNGLNLVFKEYDSGVASADALNRGEIDLAACAEFVVVGKVLDKDEIQIIANIDKFENVYIIGLKDKGISGYSDLKGKRIGIVRQASDEFYLGQFLDINGMSIRQVTLLNITRAQSVDALTSGDVDAVAVIQPYAETLKQKFGDNVVIWPLQSGQLDYFNIISKDTWVASHPEVIVRLLRSLVQAENYVASHPDEAKAIIQKLMNYDDAFINTVWPKHHFTVSLDQPLILAMEDQARWMITNNLTTETQVPNFLNFIYTDALKSVKPDAVRIAGK